MVHSATIPHLIRHFAEETPAAPALLAPSRAPLSYAGLANRMGLLSGTLSGAGIKRTDSVATVLPNGPELAVVYAAVTATAIFAPLNPNYREAEYEFYLNDLKPKALIVMDGASSPSLAVAARLGVPVFPLRTLSIEPAGACELAIPGSVAETAAGWARPEDTSLVLHTSGTTSRPKIVPLSHRNLCTSAANIARSLQLTGEDRALTVMPLFHIHGLVASLLSTWCAGGSAVVPGGFDAARFLDWVREFRPTWYTSAPTIHQSVLLRARRNPALVRGHSFRFLRSCSAPLPLAVMAALEETFSVPVIESLGMTEAAHQITSNPLPPGRRKPGSVGVPAGPKVAIMDRDGNLLPARATGEVAIRGPNVTGGYADNPEANRSAFTNGWFRTGDEGYLDDDGYLFLTGRLKEMINCGGEKIAPREIDELLLTHPSIEQAIAFAVPHAQLGEVAGVAVIPRDGCPLTEAGVSEFVAGKLADFKIPRVVRIVDEIPKGPTGKLRRIGLAGMLGIEPLDDTESPEAVEYVPPGTKLEHTLAEIWRAVLRVDTAGIHDSFFSLGGDSILCVRMLARARERAGVRISLPRFFRDPTIAGLTACPRETPGEEPELKAARGRGLSFVQERIWFFEQLEPNSSVYRMPILLALSGKLDRAALDRSLTEITRRHEVLRTRYENNDGAPVSVVDPPRPVPLPLTDLSGCPAGEREHRTRETILEDYGHPIDLATDAPLRASLYRLGPDEYRLLVVLHHIAADGWSRAIFRRELALCYEAFCNGREPDLPVLNIQYSDYAGWQRYVLEGETGDKLRDYWLSRFNPPPPVLELPADHPRPPKIGAAGDEVTLHLAPELTHRLEDLSRREDATLFMTLLAAFQVLLHRYTGSVDLVTGVPISTRTRVEFENLVGPFLNTLAVRSGLGGKPSFREFLARLRAATIAGYEHQEFPFEKLVEEVQPPRDLAHTPLVQTMFQLRNFPRDQFAFPELAIRELHLNRRAATFDLSLDVEPAVGGLDCVLAFKTELFEPATMSRFLNHYQTLLESVVEDPAASIATVSILTPEDHHRICAGWNQNRKDYPRVLLHELFEQQARRRPEQIALDCSGQKTTYAELNTRANRWARQLRRTVGKTGQRIAVALEPTGDMITALLAILKTGHAYLPLDPIAPVARNRFILEDARPVALVTTERQAASYESLGVPILTIEELLANERSLGADNLNVAISDDAPAYVIYTSGSTGHPKGVLCPHRGIVNTLQWQVHELGENENDRVLIRSNCIFDASVTEIFGGLSAGACLVVPPPGCQRDIVALVRTIAERNVTVMHTVPSVLRAMMEVPDFDRCTHLRLVLNGGDVLPPAVAIRFLASLPSCTLTNLYGPTENAVDSTCWICRPGDTRATLPIGRPLPNTTAYILDAELQPVPIGVSGELCLGGAGVALGYLNHPELTKEVLLRDPFSGDPTARLYRTGDLARYLPDGNIEFLGRRDHQVKLRGFRVELGEIEEVLERHPALRQAAVVLRPAPSGDRQIVAYFTAASRTSPPEAGLRSWLREQLPDYMIPARFVKLTEFPRTPSAKIARNALPDPPPLANPGEGETESESEELVLRLTAIWEDVLGVSPIGTRDDFFALGGHSLLAVRLFSRIEKRLGKSLPIATIFESPTISALADVIREGGWNSPWHCLVPLQPRGQRPPLFLMHALGGNVMFYRTLARQLGLDQPVYGLQSAGLDGSRPPLTTVEQMASAYLEEIRELQPRGPYHLAGFCFGSYIALEVALQLVDAGEKVAFLAAMDTDGRWRLARTAREDIRYHLGNLRLLSPAAWPSYLAERIRFRRRRVRNHRQQVRRRKRLRSGGSLTAEERLEFIAETNWEASARYRPRVFPGRLIYFRGDPDPLQDPAPFWGSVSGGRLEIRRTDGTGAGVLEEPHVRILAREIRAAMDASARSGLVTASPPRR